MKKKIIISIILACVIGIGTGLGIFIYSKNYGNIAYNDAIEARYKQVEKNLNEKLIRANTDEDVFYKFLFPRKITYLKFFNLNEESIDLQVYYSGTFNNDLGSSEWVGYVIYNVSIDNYNALVSANNSGNVLYYLDTLNNIFTEMQFVDSYYNEPISCKLFEYTEKNKENIKKFNEIYALDNLTSDDIVRQIGFLPYNLTLVDYKYDFDTKRHDYTYKISGISYCQTKSASSDKVKNDKNLIIESSYDKNHIKAFNRDILFTSSLVNEVGMDSKYRVGGDLYMIINGINSPYTIETILFEDREPLEIYEELKSGNFEFEKSKEFDVKEYVDNMK